MKSTTGKYKRVKFKRWHCDVVKTGYQHNGQIALLLLDSRTGKRVAVATVCLDVEIPSNYCLIKNWSENEGIQEVLVEAGIIKLTGRSHPAGFVYADEAEVLI